MKLFGKNVPTDKINFVMNCISFVLGIIFFVRMQIRMNEVPVPVSFNAEHDSLIRIETRIDFQIRELKTIQDSIKLALKVNQKKLSEEETKVTAKRQVLIANVKTDWDHLGSPDRDKYINNLLLNIKQKKK